MFRLFDTEEEFSYHGVFWSYSEAKAAIADAEDEFPDSNFEVQELVSVSDEESEWQAATDPEGE